MKIIRVWNSIYRLSQAVQIIFAIAVFISYGLQGYVPVEIIWKTYLREKLEGSSSGKLTFYEYLTRVVVAIFICKMVLNWKLRNRYKVYVNICRSSSRCNTETWFIHLVNWSSLFVSFGISISSLDGNLCVVSRRIIDI